MNSDYKNKHVFIPRILLIESTDEKLPIPIKRTQSIIRLWFTTKINKAQGQT